MAFFPGETLIKYVVRNAENPNTVVEGKGGGDLTLLQYPHRCCNNSWMLTCIQKRILSTTTMQFLQTALHPANSHASSRQPCIPQIVRIPLISMHPNYIYASHRQPGVPPTPMNPTDSHASHRQLCIPKMTAVHPTDSHASHRQPCIPQPAVQLSDSYASHIQLCISETAMHLTDSHESHRQPNTPPPKKSRSCQQWWIPHKVTELFDSP
jgi:hypothetical protein